MKCHKTGWRKGADLDPFDLFSGLNEMSVTCFGLNIREVQNNSFFFPASSQPCSQLPVNVSLDTNYTKKKVFPSSTWCNQKLPHTRIKDKCSFLHSLICTERFNLLKHSDVRQFFLWLWDLISCEARVGLMMVTGIQVFWFKHFSTRSHACI